MNSVIPQNLWQRAGTNDFKMKSMQPKKIQRQEKIIAAFEINPALTVNELATQMMVSEETLRRDLKDLDVQGKIRRTHGGAISKTYNIEPSLNKRLHLNVEQRSKIASYACSQLAGIRSMFIGGGATTFHFARALKMTEMSITVITASLDIANELASAKTIEVFLLPGFVEPTERQVHGAETIKAVSNYSSQLAVIGASGIDYEGVSEVMIRSAQVYKSMIHSAEHTWILADSTKFEKRALSKLMKWNPRSSLITDAYPDLAFKTQILDAGANILTTEKS